MNGLVPEAVSSMMLVVLRRIDSRSIALSASSISGLLRVSIAFKPTDDQAVIGAFSRALDQGLTPVLRICAGPTCDFSDPQVYAQFLKTIADGLNGRTFWAIAGPNEPETEPWVLTNTTPGSTPVQADWLTLLGPIRKLIPKKVLDARKNDVIDRALLPAGNPNKSYNQIVAFVKNRFCPKIA